MDTWKMLPLILGMMVGEALNKAYSGLPDSWRRKNWANLKIDPAYLKNANVRAFLKIIRMGETSLDDMAYRTMNGNAEFTAPPWQHPRRVYPGGTTNAAGAYQIRAATWDGAAKANGLKDFSPANQDFAAVAIIGYRGALPAVLEGDLDEAFRILAPSEWPSLPGGPQSKGRKALATKQFFVGFGGKLKN